MADAGAVLGIGADCEDVARWRDLQSDLKRGSVAALFSEEEHAYCRSFPDPALVYAGRWCAKEAVFKALSGIVRISLRDIYITNDAQGRPKVCIQAKHFDPQRFNIFLSISHTKTVALAFAIVSAADQR